MDEREDPDTTTEALATGLQGITSALHALGNADASTPMGALEVLALCLKEGLEAVAMALSECAEAIRESHGGSQG